MSWLLGAQIGMQVLGGAMQYGADKAQYKATKAWQKYKNTMLNLSNAVSQNAITTNEILSQQASTQQAIDMKRGNILTSAKAEVSAAAAGVKGRSVNQTLMDINRNAAMAERQRQISFSNANLAFDQQRLNSSMSAAMQTDYSYIPKPNPASYMLKAASAGYDIFQAGKAGGSDGSGNYTRTTGQSAANPNIAGTRYMF